MKLLYAYNNFLKNPAFKSTNEDVNVYKEIYKVDADGWLVDRTGTVTFPWQTKLLDRYKHIEKSPSYDFETCCLLNATKYIETGKPIILMWSGGIDSTAMVVAFLKVAKDLSNITVAFNNDSVREYPSFYKNYICGKVKGLSTEELVLRITTSGIGDTILLSAEHADQLFGSPLAGGIAQTLGLEFLTKPFNQNNFRTLFTSKGVPQRYADCWFDLYNETSKHSPKPIQTMFDMAWWHGFNFRWQAIGMKIYPRINSNVDFRTFYSDTMFQQWSIDQTFTMDSIGQLKTIPKDFIFEFTGDADYRDNKIKHPSSTLYYAKPAASAILEDFTKLPKIDIMDYYDLDNSIANWLKTH
jgi:hypothetical protein